MHFIDFRSDTVTRPTEAMLKAMMKAEVGDDVFEDDPTVNALQIKAADMFGMEAALFCPSGTMTNQIAINVHTRPGDELICAHNAHIYLYEGGGIARNSGCSQQLITTNDGQMKASQIEEAIRADDPHYPRTTLVCLENTCNKGGGSCYELSEIEKIHSLCRERDLRLHLDGARLFNALVKTKQKATDYGRMFDSISICLSKGLGCPVGSLLLASEDFIYHARRTRKVFGGGMRQVGYLAAAGIYALDHHVDRLEEDHKNAHKLATALKKSRSIFTVKEPETNIVIGILKSGVSPESYLEQLKSHGILAVKFGADTIRLIPHLSVSQEDIKHSCEVIAST